MDVDEVFEEIPSPNVNSATNRFDHSFQAPQSSQASALIATPELVSYQSWYADSGATSQDTAELGNHSLESDYHDEGKLAIGNGNKLHITHIGCTEIPFLSSYLCLRNILLVPQIIKSLLSISLLSADNEVFVEFYSNFCLVKDKENHQVLLEGRLEDGLYKLHIPETKNLTKSVILSSVNPSINLTVELNLDE